MISFAISGGTERAISRGHWAQMQFPQNVVVYTMKKLIASALWQLRVNFTCIFKVFPKLPLLLLYNLCEMYSLTL